MTVSYDYDRETGSYTEHEPEQTVARVTWHDHTLFLREYWSAGEHVSIINQTGGGKSYLFVHGLAPLLSFEDLVILDGKNGDDKELNSLKLRHITKLPSRLQKKLEGDSPHSHWYHYYANRQDDTRHLLDSCYQQGNITLYFDEVRQVVDKFPGLGLAGQVDQLWLRGRSRGITVVAGTQAPRFVPSAFYEQARHLYIGHLLDRRAQRRLEEIGGDTDAIEDVVAHLGLYEFLYIGPLQEDATRTMQIVKVPAP